MRRSVARSALRKWKWRKAAMPPEGMNFAATDVRESVGSDVVSVGDAVAVVPVREQRAGVQLVGQWAVEPELKRNEPSEGEGSHAGRGRGTNGLV
jgi:hypothetical protein